MVNAHNLFACVRPAGSGCQGRSGTTGLVASLFTGTRHVKINRCVLLDTLGGIVNIGVCVELHLRDFTDDVIDLLARLDGRAAARHA
jgi:hypothetical protein